MFENFEYGYIIIAFVVLLTAWIVSKLIRLVLKKFIDKSTDKLRVDPTNYNFLKHAVNFIIYTTAITIIFFIVPSLRELGVTLVASAGLFAAVIGFASQQAFSNIISGIFIVIFKPFRVGDNVMIQLERGIIEDITLRHTIIRNFESRRVIIPNSIISNETVLNSTIADTKICNFFEFGISYESDVDRAKEIVKEEALNHKNFLDNRSEQEKADGVEPVIVRMLSWGESSLMLRAYVWTEDSGKGFVLKCDLYELVRKRFNAEGIEIPYPHRTILTKGAK